jgi:hypothetical protein
MQISGPLEVQNDIIYNFFFRFFRNNVYLRLNFQFHFYSFFQISETWKDLWLNKLEIQVKASDNKRNNISID